VTKIKGKINAFEVCFDPEKDLFFLQFREIKSELREKKSQFWLFSHYCEFMSRNFDFFSRNSDFFLIILTSFLTVARKTRSFSWSFSILASLWLFFFRIARCELTIVWKSQKSELWDKKLQLSFFLFWGGNKLPYRSHESEKITKLLALGISKYE